MPKNQDSTTTEGGQAPMQHTPEPWELQIQPNQFSPAGYIADICGNFKGPDGDTIARLTTEFAPGGREMTKAEVLANGRLMAAAPRMLEELRFALRYLDNPEVVALPFALPATAAAARVEAAIDAATLESGGQG